VTTLDSAKPCWNTAEDARTLKPGDENVCVEGAGIPPKSSIMLAISVSSRLKLSKRGTDPE